MNGIQILGMIMAIVPMGLCLLAGLFTGAYIAVYRIKDENDWSAAILEIIMVATAIITILGCYLWKYGGIK